MSKGHIVLPPDLWMLTCHYDVGSVNLFVNFQLMGWTICMECVIQELQSLVEIKLLFALHAVWILHVQNHTKLEGFTSVLTWLANLQRQNYIILPSNRTWSNIIFGTDVIRGFVFNIWNLIWWHFIETVSRVVWKSFGEWQWKTISLMCGINIIQFLKFFDSVFKTQDNEMYWYILFLSNPHGVIRLDDIDDILCRIFIQLTENYRLINYEQRQYWWNVFHFNCWTTCNNYEQHLPGFGHCWFFWSSLMYRLISQKV